MEKCHICGWNKKHLQKINKIQQKLLESEIESLSSFYKIMGGVLLGFLLFSFIHML